MHDSPIPIASNEPGDTKDEDTLREDPTVAKSMYYVH